MAKLFFKAGWVERPQKGSHLIVVHPNGRHESIPQHKELGKGLERKLLKTLEETK